MGRKRGKKRTSSVSKKDVGREMLPPWERPTEQKKQPGGRPEAGQGGREKSIYCKEEEEVAGWKKGWKEEAQNFLSLSAPPSKKKRTEYRLHHKGF